MWVAVPALLVQAGLDKDHHWWVYLPAVLASFVVMGGTLFPLEKRGHLRAVFLGAIALIGLVQLGLYLVADGMGGHTAGHVASEIAAQAAVNALRTPADATASLADKLRLSVAAANREILDTAERKPELSGMGTTLDKTNSRRKLQTSPNCLHSGEL